MSEDEIWKDIEGYDGVYQISNLGRVRSFYNNKYGNSDKYKLKKPTLKINKDGKYFKVSLYKNSKHKNYYIHRLVAFHFIENPNPTKYIYVDHIDANSENNRVENLRWCCGFLNNLNQKVRNKSISGYKGVHWNKRINKWHVDIRYNYKTIYGGIFDNLEDAINKRKELEKQYFNSDFYRSQ